MADKKMLIWLPSPMGDAILSVPALRAFRRHFSDHRILFWGSAVNRAILSPSPFCDGWMEPPGGYLKSISVLKEAHLSACILLKNSFGSALSVRLAGVERRIGYARDGRSVLLTEKIDPLKDGAGHFVPTPATEYYLRIAESLGADITDRTTELSFTEADRAALAEPLPGVFDRRGPLVILVPGGAFGPSKCWPSERFSKTADALIEKHKATVLVSVAPNEREQQIAAEIVRHARGPLINLGQTPLALGPLKALFACADLVITNDTGPRHIAIALKRRVVTLFGPNNPQWTQTDYADEIRIVGTGPCVPCDKPVCRQPHHYCMESITVEQVLEAAEAQLAKGRT